MKRMRETGMFTSDYVFMALSTLSPITHEFSWGHYRVPVQVNDDYYVVYVGDNHRRYYTDDTLPEFIKHRIGMIKASPRDDIKTDRELHKLDLYKSRGRGFEYVGWQASETMFIVIMSEEEVRDARS